MNYLSYKSIQASIYDKECMEELKEICYEDFDNTFDLIKKFIELNENGRITYSAREELYNLVYFFRNDFEYKSFEDRAKAYEILNEIIGTLNKISICSEADLIIDEMKKRYPENRFVQINLSDEFVNDLEVMNDLSDPINDEIISKYTMNDQFLGSLNAIFSETKNMASEIFVESVHQILKENLKRCNNYKQYGIDISLALYIKLRTINIDTMINKKNRKEEKMKRKITKKIMKKNK